MKKFIFLMLAATLCLTSCSLDNIESPGFYTDFMPITNVEVPSEFVFGETHEITVSYLRPSDCYQFNNFFLQRNDGDMTVAVINTIYTDISCTDINEVVDVSFDLSVTNNSNYIFKFWQGENFEGEDQYYIVEVPVIQ